MYRRILVATDGSYHSQMAEDRGITLAKSLSSSLAGLYVIDTTHYRWSDELKEELRSKLEREGRRILESFSKKASREGVKVDILLEEGYPPQEIIGAGEGYDLVVMGHRGLGPAEESLGSVAQRVLRRGKTDVMVVKG